MDKATAGSEAGGFVKASQFEAYNQEAVRLALYHQQADCEQRGLSARTLHRIAGLDPYSRSFLFTTIASPLMPLYFEQTRIVDRLDLLDTVKEATLPDSLSVYHGLNAAALKLVFQNNIRLTLDEQRVHGLDAATSNRITNLSFNHYERLANAACPLVRVAYNDESLWQAIENRCDSLHRVKALVQGGAGYSLIAQLYPTIHRRTYNSVCELCGVRPLQSGRSQKLSPVEGAQFVRSWCAHAALGFEERLQRVAEETGLSIIRCWIWMVRNYPLAGVDMSGVLPDHEDIFHTHLSRREARLVRELWSRAKSITSLSLGEAV